MRTLDRRLLAWSDDSDTEKENLQTAASWDLAVDDDLYDRCAATLVDDVLVPGPDGSVRKTTLAAGSSGDRGGICTRPSSAARKACAVAGLVAVGGLCAYLAWRCCTSKLPSLS